MISAAAAGRKVMRAQITRFRLAELARRQPARRATSSLQLAAPTISRGREVRAATRPRIASARPRRRSAGLATPGMGVTRERLRSGP
jgi:hypothetical protein